MQRQQTRSRGPYLFAGDGLVDGGGDHVTLEGREPGLGEWAIELGTSNNEQNKVQTHNMHSQNNRTIETTTTLDIRDSKRGNPLP